MWDVDVRAVRQEMAKPRSMGWLVEKTRLQRSCVAMGFRYQPNTSGHSKKLGKCWSGFCFENGGQGGGHINPPRAKPVPRTIY